MQLVLVFHILMIIILRNLQINLIILYLNIPMNNNHFLLIQDYYLQNIFVRSNKDFTQFIVIKPETVRNSNKCFKSKFKPNNSNVVEDFMSFKREDVETYNLVNNSFVLDKNYELQQSIY